MYAHYNQRLDRLIPERSPAISSEQRLVARREAHIIQASLPPPPRTTHRVQSRRHNQYAITLGAPLCPPRQTSGMEFARPSDHHPPPPYPPAPRVRCTNDHCCSSRITLCSSRPGEGCISSPRAASYVYRARSLLSLFRGWEWGILIDLAAELIARKSVLCRMLRVLIWIDCGGVSRWAWPFLLDAFGRHAWLLFFWSFYFASAVLNSFHRWSGGHKCSSVPNNEMNRSMFRYVWLSLSDTVKNIVKDGGWELTTGYQKLSSKVLPRPVILDSLCRVHNKFEPRQMRKICAKILKLLFVCIVNFIIADLIIFYRQKPLEKIVNFSNLWFCSHFIFTRFYLYFLSEWFNIITLKMVGRLWCIPISFLFSFWHLKSYDSQLMLTLD